jgi:predicted ATP-grasp superfamily ATP-dependent carboligase
MHSRWRAKFMSDAPAVLIAATSARALATSARRAGYAPLVVDFFADDDTRDEAERCLRFEGGLAAGFQLEAFMEACERLVDSRTIVGFVYGAGFEDRPALLEAAARRWRLLGNSAEIVSRLKDPIFFADFCRSNAIPHPEIAQERPTHPSLWLARQRGGSGGGHIRPCEEASLSDARTYYQRKAPGRPVSALILADGARCSILGFSEQWSAHQEGRPFRFAGAARPAAIVPGVEQALESVARRICSTIPLVGLNSLDFLVSESGFWLLEVNPRPGATLDLFEADSGRESLFALHIAACRGEIKPTPEQHGACAFEILYADFEIARTPALNWPAWTRDRQPEGSFVAKGDPFCTIVARGATTSEVRRDLADGAATIRLSIQSQVA